MSDNNREILVFSSVTQIACMIFLPTSMKKKMLEFLILVSRKVISLRITFRYLLISTHTIFTSLSLRVVYSEDKGIPTDFIIQQNMHTNKYLNILMDMTGYRIKSTSHQIDMASVTV